MKNEYIPSEKILKKYADLLINYALNSGQGIKKGEIVECAVPDVAKPLALELQNTILKSGGHPLIRLLPTGFDKDYFDLANHEQLTFFPRAYMRAKAKLIDHHLSILADVDPKELKDVPPQKIMTARNSKKPYREWLNHKEVNNQFTWTLGLWGTEAKAKEVGLSIEDYWDQIIQGCYLNEEDPVATWRKIQKEQEEIKQKLNDLKIEYVIMRGQNVDLTIKIGENRIWQGGSGRNIPSFEIFTSPDWRETEGHIAFNEPIYRYGNKIVNAQFEFHHGKVTKASAKEGNTLLQEMLKTKNANKLGEFSMTDKKMSKITHPMAETLFDENIGGPFGNSHIAIGTSYKDCYRYDASKLSKKQWQEIGFNESAEHTDFITTEDRTIIAVLPDHKELVIYDKGEFKI